VLIVKRTVVAPKVTFVRAMGGHAAASHGHDDHHDHGHHEEEEALAPVCVDFMVTSWRNYLLSLLCLVVQGYYHGYPRTRLEGDVVIPQLVDTLEWVLSSPPAVHSFNEPPVSSLNFHFPA
jgi:hypothetical protein